MESSAQQHKRGHNHWELQVEIKWHAANYFPEGRGGTPLIRPPATIVPATDLSQWRSLLQYLAEAETMQLDFNTCNLQKCKLLQ